ncbi:MAG: type IV pilus modification protein PilV [Saccharospirillaceae bacterium]|nr:type IV pilus modification protein PilV [Pseudomonadales bacterium]NRB77080.1 type IV pilus modification protein PilV [Saccharospirillaceae bacterium]
MLVKNTQFGVGLLEVLIALFIVSVSLVTMAKVININLKQQTNIYNKSSATFLVNDMVERIKANSQQDYTIEKSKQNPDYSDEFCEFKRCNPQQLKQYDVNQWLYLITEQLPNANGVINKVGDKYTIKVYWDSHEVKGLFNNNKVEVKIII